MEKESEFMNISIAVTLLASIIANLFALWIIFTQQVQATDIFALLLFEAFLVMIFGIVKVYCLKKEEVESPGYGFQSTKTANVLFIISPINITLLFNILVFVLGGLLLLVYLFTVSNGGQFLMVSNKFFVNNSLLAFFIVEIASLAGFTLAQNRKSTDVVRETNYYTFPICLIMLAAFAIFQLRLTAYFNAFIFVALVFIAKIIVDILHYGVKKNPTASVGSDI